MSLFGTRISFTVHRSGWVLIAVLMVLGWRDLGLERGLLGGLLVTLCLVIHEVAHTAMALVLAVPVHGIGVRFLGAYTFRKYASRRAHDVMIAAAGPLASVVLTFASFFVPHVGVWLAEWNCGIVVVNLLPFPGTDGYRILKTIFRPDAALYPPRVPDAA